MESVGTSDDAGNGSSAATDPRVHRELVEYADLGTLEMLTVFSSNGAPAFAAMFMRSPPDAACWDATQAVACLQHFIDTTALPRTMVSCRADVKVVNYQSYDPISRDCQAFTEGTLVRLRCPIPSGTIAPSSDTLSTQQGPR